MMRGAIETPLAIIEVPSEATDGNTERATSLLFVKTFTGKNGEKVYYFKSVTVKKDGLEVSVSSHYDRPKRIKEALKKRKLLCRFDGGAQTEQRPADVSVTASPDKSQGKTPKVYSVPAVGEDINTDTSEVNSGQTEGATAPAGNSSQTSDRKDNQSLSEEQISEGESSSQLSEGEIDP